MDVCVCVCVCVYVSSAGRPWRKRIPVLIAATQMLNKWQWRISQRAFRGWATLGQPEITHVSQLSPEYRALVEFVSSMTTHSLRRIRYVRVLDTWLTNYRVLSHSASTVHLCACVCVSVCVYV